MILHDFMNENAPWEAYGCLDCSRRVPQLLRNQNVCHSVHMNTPLDFALTNMSSEHIYIHRLFRPISILTSHLVGFDLAASIDNDSSLYSVKLKVNLSLWLSNQASRHEDLRRSGGISLPFLILNGGEWSAFTPRPLYPRNKPHDTHWKRDWEGPRIVTDAMEYRTILYPYRESNTERPIDHRCTDYSLSF